MRRVVLEQLVKEKISNGRTSQRCTGVTALSLLHRVHGQ